MPDQVKDHEPELALFVENEDALLFYRNITDFATQHISSKGQLFFELNEFNAVEVVQLVNRKGFSDVQVHKDLNGKERMLKGNR